MAGHLSEFLAHPANPTRITRLLRGGGPRLAGVVLAGVLAARLVPSVSHAATLARVDHVTDGDTIVLRNRDRVRLVQIDTARGSGGGGGLVFPSAGHFTTN